MERRRHRPVASLPFCASRPQHDSEELPVRIPAVEGGRQSQSLINAVCKAFILLAAKLSTAHPYPKRSFETPCARGNAEMQPNSLALAGPGFCFDCGSLDHLGFSSSKPSCPPPPPRPDAQFSLPSARGCKRSRWQEEEVESERESEMGEDRRKVFWHCDLAGAQVLRPA